MTDVVLVAVIVAFFVAAAFIVRALDHMIAHAGIDADPEDEASQPGAEASQPGAEASQPGAEVR
jgi:hypothetical protein